MKTEDRLRARQLRADHGLPMKEIARRLGVSVSSVSLWVRNPRYNSQRRGHGGRRESSRRVRATAQQRGREMARLGDPLHRSGCMLHWAEGSKSRNVAGITNSDPDLLRLYRYFLRDCYGVSDGRIALTGNFHLGNGLTVDDIHAYWLRTLELPAACLRKPSVVAPSRDPLKRRRLPYGTVSLSVCSVELVQSIYGAIQEYAGFDRPEWLG